MAQQFFASDAMQRNLSKALQVLDAESDEAGKYLREVLFIIQQNPQSFDERCALNIEWIGTSISNSLQLMAAERKGNPGRLSDLVAAIFRIVVEYELSQPGELALELRRFMDWVHSNASQLGGNAPMQVDYARHQMPVSILKKLLGNEVVRSLPSYEAYASAVDGRIKAWNADLDAREARVNALKDALAKHESGFNFVGLHKGFDDLSVVKKGEIRWLRRYVVALGTAVLCPLGVELGLLYFYRAQLSALNLPLLLSVVPAVSLTIILIYYFRLVVRALEGAKAQLSQIELRKTMCRFVESYAEFGKRIKTDNAETLGKFENMIFSNIVGSDEKLPATFDGVEQLSTLIKSVKS